MQLTLNAIVDHYFAISTLDFSTFLVYLTQYTERAVVADIGNKTICYRTMGHFASTSSRDLVTVTF